MEHFAYALETSIETENWYSVLFISLSLPDICGKIDEPNNKSSKERTINWFNKYLKSTYTRKIGPEKREYTFLSGSDFYALRCAYLHEGKDDITSQKAQETLEKFKFIQPISNSFIMHRNKSGNILQLQVSEFGKEVLNAVEKWLLDIRNDPIKQKTIDSLLYIEIPNTSNGITF
ncbi:hypothetical protein [Acinetobacter pittii]